MTSSNENILRVTGPLCRQFTGNRWNPLTKASNAGLWWFLWPNGWGNNRDAGDMIRHCAHYDVKIMKSTDWWLHSTHQLWGFSWPLSGLFTLFALRLILSTHFIILGCFILIAELFCLSYKRDVILLCCNFLQIYNERQYWVKIYRDFIVSLIGLIASDNAMVVSDIWGNDDLWHSDFLQA